jgi:hypothetical protein
VTRAPFFTLVTAVVLATTACNGGSGFSGTSGHKSPPKEKDEDVELGGIETAAGGSTATGTSADATPLILGGTDTAFDQRLEEQGAQTGDIQVSLLWNNANDLDLHMVGPTGEHIYFAAETDSIGGYLDIDMNAGSTVSMTPIENVFWSAGQAARGTYKIYVHHYLNRGTENPSAFKVRLKVGESITFYEGSVAYSEQTDFSGGDASGFGFGDALPVNAVLVHQFTY